MFFLLCLFTATVTTKQIKFSGVPHHRREAIGARLDMFNNQFEKGGEYSVIDQFIRSGQTVFDVGANIGTWSYYVLRRNGNIKLYAFEPTPSIFEKLKENLKQWDLANLHKIALNSQDNICAFFCYDHHIFNSLIYLPHRKQIAANKQGKIDIETRSLDSFCQEHNINTIDFLKIDTEGAELIVLLGAQKLLKTNRIKVIQFEYNECSKMANATLQDIYQLLTSSNYLIYRIERNRLVPITQWNQALENYKYNNFLAIINNPTTSEL